MVFIGNIEGRVIGRMSLSLLTMISSQQCSGHLSTPFHSSTPINVHQRSIASTLLDSSVLPHRRLLLGRDFLDGVLRVWIFSDWLEPLFPLRGLPSMGGSIHIPGRILRCCLWQKCEIGKVHCGKGGVTTVAGR